MSLADRPLWQTAAMFAAVAHRHQLRKDGKTPYTAHPFRVAMTVRDVFGCADPVALCAAILHDTIEDTQTDYDDILLAFGRDVADLVAALTKNMILREDIRDAEYDERLSRADWRARLVKLADVFDNYSDVDRGSTSPEPKLRARCEKAIQLAQTDRTAHPETDRAIRAVEQLLRS